jgi:hypothetical protein
MSELVVTKEDDKPLCKCNGIVHSVLINANSILCLNPTHAKFSLKFHKLKYIKTKVYRCI